MVTPLKDYSEAGRHGYLAALCEEWDGCTKCRLSETRNSIVFGEGPPIADFFFVGDGPGDDEDRTGRPFEGPGGQLLYDLIQAAEMDPARCFFTNLVMCRPVDDEGKGRRPTKPEIDSCIDRLWQQVYAVDPLIIVPVGPAAMAATMKGEWKKILSCRGKMGYAKCPGRYVAVSNYHAVPILDPNYILRSDRISPRTSTWVENGPAHKTLTDLSVIKKTADVIRKDRKSIRRQLEKQR